MPLTLTHRPGEAILLTAPEWSARIEILNINRDSVALSIEKPGSMKTVFAAERQFVPVGPGAEIRVTRLQSRSATLAYIMPASVNITREENIPVVLNI